MTAAAVADDAVQPALETGRLAAAREMAIRPHQPFRHGIRRGVRIAQHARGVAQQAGLVAANQNAERLDITRQDARDNVDVRGVAVHCG